ncbi:DUF4350 domain-containing protein [Cryobacterium sp. PH31-AA6]|uniref:DUF4350 domain-containing protein n=1 Tax=Cryobacterium sp. PH31-AA6 TaxID=3046205 RepID=UPI0024BB4749|nr:DUF4350 domain-containing protein [Cryobacterium sp. PH31-AA6]MDJ0323881.1 DUF4350 domain-containing protein [Cryobacterium sp. PH31-AA6]
MTGAPAADASTRATPDAESSTPTLRLAFRRSAFWIAAGAGALIVAIIATVLAGGGQVGGPPLAADNPAPAGAMALVEVLRSQGVSVTVADTLAEATAAAAGSTDSTLFSFDADGYLTRTQLETMAGLATRTVLADPDFDAILTLAPGVGFGGLAGTDPRTASCDIPAAVKAGRVSPGGKTLSITANGDADADGLTGCFPSGATAFSLVSRTAGDRTLTLVADTAVFRNDTITLDGNAALALNLLGSGGDLIWYLPTLADVARTGPPSLGELTPGWVTPTLVLLVLVSLAAMVWRGRRFGPLVAENLPVTVRAGETMEGRARLYARSSARLRALDALRVGAIQRLAAKVGLSRLATLDDVVLAVAAAAGRAPAEVRLTLVDALPTSDRDLVTLSDRIQDLERATTRTPTSPPPGRMDP